MKIPFNPTGHSAWTGRGLLALMLVAMTSVYAAAGKAGPTDHVLLIDNSLAAGKVDPKSRLRDGLTAFIGALPRTDRLAIVLYDDLATPIAALQPVGNTGRTQLIDALNALGFSSDLANPAAGLERAIYELRSQRRAGTSRILLIQASRINTGDPEQDTAFRVWVEKVLIDRAVNHDISVDVISVGADADRDLGRQLAEGTAGRHLQVRASERLGATLTDLAIKRHSSQMASSLPVSSLPSHTPTYDQTVNDIDRLTRLAPPQAGSASTERTTNRWQEPDATIAASPSQPSAPDDATSGRLFGSLHLGIPGPQLLTIGLASTLLMAIGGGIYRMRRRRPVGLDERFPAATRQPNDQGAVRLLDLKGVSGKDHHVITGRLARICRNAGQDTFNVVCITISDDVISREHAFIECRQGEYWISDPGSNNGTFVNGKRVRGSRVLRDGDRLRFATYEFLFQHDVSTDDLSSTEEVTAFDPMKTHVAPRPLAMACDPEEQTVAGTLVYQPTANEDSIRQGSATGKPAP